MSSNTQGDKTTSEENEQLGTLLYYIDITIQEAEKRANSLMNIRDSYIVYLTETKWKSSIQSNVVDIPEINFVWRRYTEFEQLKHYLQDEYPYVFVPPLPEKKQSYTWHNTNSISNDATDPDFVDRRRVALENFLHRVASHPILCKDQLFIKFLTIDQGWNECLKQAGYKKKMEDRIKELSILPKVQIMDPKWNMISNCGRNLELYIGEILKDKMKLNERVYSVNQLHSHYGRLFSEWSVIEKSMGDSFQRIGHFIDTIPAASETSLQDEDVIIDQLKEYLFYAPSIEAVCNHRDKMLNDLSNLKETLNAKVQEKNRIQSGKTNVISRLFGALQTPELREERVTQLQQCIETENIKLQSAQSDFRQFLEYAKEDFQRFQKRKQTDIQETLSTYANQQLRIAKRGLATWINIKNCIESIP